MAAAISARPGMCRAVRPVDGARLRRGRGCRIWRGDLRAGVRAVLPNNPPWVGVPPVPKVPTASSTLRRPERSERADARARRRAAVRQRQQPHPRGRQRPDLLQALHARGRQGHLRQTTKRMRAEGNARFTEADGKVIYGEIIDLTDDFRDGFVDSLQLEAADKTRFAAPRAERTERPLHRVPERRLHRLRAVQGRSAASRRAGRCARRASSTTTPRR